MKDETREDLATILCGHALNHFWPYCDWGKFEFAGCWVSEYNVLGEKCGLVRFHRTSFTGRRSSPCQVAHCKALPWMFGLPAYPLPGLWETHFKKSLNWFSNWRLKEQMLKSNLCHHTELCDEKVGSRTRVSLKALGYSEGWEQYQRLKGGRQYVSTR